MSSFLCNYWIFGKSCQIKRVISHCVICFPFTSKPQQQIMADLPTNRVTPHRPFLHTGVDFAGTISTKAFIGRCRGVYKKTHTKSYMAIFICLATRAIHIEVVSDLTSVAFIQAFKRIVARRGTKTDLYSDCGSNFVGADRLMREEMLVLLEDGKVQNYFNPPASPHFGGLWEAGVKPIKFHLNTVGLNHF